MSLKENMDYPLNLPTISSFIKFISKILDVETTQNEEVIQGRTISTKLSRFNDNYLSKIIKSVIGLDIVPQNWIKSNDKKNLNYYQDLLKCSVEFCEIIISLGNNQFIFQNREKEQLIKDYISYFIVPYIFSSHDQLRDLPLFSPITQLSSIAAKLVLNSSETTSNVITAHLREKFRLINTNDLNDELYLSISHINENEIIKSKNLISKIEKFIECLHKKHTPEIDAFIGSYRCCIILLRLKRELGNDLFQFFIRTLIMNVFLNQYDNNLGEKQILFIETQYCDLIKDEVTEDEYINYKDNLRNFYILYNSFTSYVNVKNELNKLTDSSKISHKKCMKEIQKIQLEYLAKTSFISSPSNVFYFLEFCFNQVITTASALFENFAHFKNSNQSPISQLLIIGIRNKFDSIPDNKISKNYLIELKNKLKTFNEPYQEAILHYIDLLKSLIEGDINNGITLAKKIIYEDSKKWSLGKIKSDAFLTYIILGKMNKLFVGNMLNSILNQYYECQYPRFYLLNINFDKNSSNTLINGHIQSLDLAFSNFISQLNIESDLIHNKLIDNY